MFKFRKKKLFPETPQLKAYRLALILWVTLLEIFLFYNSYPISHILIVNLLVFLIGMTTKVRATAIGMFLGATNETIKKLINLPNTLNNLYGDGNLKRRLEEEAKYIKKNEIN